MCFLSRRLTRLLLAGSLAAASAGGLGGVGGGRRQRGRSPDNGSCSGSSPSSSSSPPPLDVSAAPRGSFSTGVSSPGEIGSAGTAGTPHTLQSRVSTLSSRRRACGLYVWDAPSALLHAWCQRLMRDSVYEGRGGRKFVRVQPGSVLQLLYPCSRYSPDRCLLCGGTYRDHLELRWSRHLYTPLDRLLDDTNRRGVRARSAEKTGPRGRGASSAGASGAPRQSRETRRRRKPSARARREATRYMTGPNEASRTMTTEHVFHRQYVVETRRETGSAAAGASKQESRLYVPRALLPPDYDDEEEADPASRRRQLRRHRRSSRGPASEGGDRVPMEVVGRGRLFFVPKLDPARHGPLVTLARAFVLRSVEGLMDREEKEK